jgi:hypothetical protein
LVILVIGFGFILGLPGLLSSYFRLPALVKMTGTGHYAQLLVKMEPHKLPPFALKAGNWPQTVILMIVTSQIARLIGMSHWHPA